MISNSDDMFPVLHIISFIKDIKLSSFISDLLLLCSSLCLICSPDQGLSALFYKKGFYR